MDAEQQAQSATPTTTEVQPSVLRTTTGKAWRLKTLGFAVALAAMAIWGWWDAFHVYPARGRLHEQFMLRNYLEAADQAFQMPTASVENPAEEYRRLSAADEQSLSDVERARMAWLRSISRISSLEQIAQENAAELEQRSTDPTHRQSTRTMFADARSVLGQLKNQLDLAQQPKPLAAYDLPVQFLFFYGGIVGSVYLLGLFAIVRSRVYTYQPATHTLTLPSGKSMTPSDIALVDKRQWDKYIVYLKPADGSAEIRLDLYRHRPLEDWILEMEKLTPGYVPPEPEPEAAPADSSGASAQ